jgi:hypothetical protein
VIGTLRDRHPIKITGTAPGRSENNLETQKNTGVDEAGMEPLPHEGWKVKLFVAVGKTSVVQMKSVRCI